MAMYTFPTSSTSKPNQHKAPAVKSPTPSTEAETDRTIHVYEPALYRNAKYEKGTGNLS